MSEHESPPACMEHIEQSWLSTLCSLSVCTNAGMYGFPSGQTVEYCACLLGIPPFALIIMFKIKCTIALVWVLICHYTVGSFFLFVS